MSNDVDGSLGLVQNHLLPILWTSASLSLVGGLSIVAAYHSGRTVRGLSLRILLYMTWTHLGTNVGFLMQNPNIEIQCLTAAAVVNFFSVSSFLWSCCLACNLFLTLFFKNVPSKKYIMGTFFALCLLIPAVCIAIPLYFDMYSRTFAEDAVGCWFKTEYSWGRFVFFDGWIIIAWLVNLIVYVLVFRRKSSIVIESLYVQQNPGLAKSAMKKQKVIGLLLLIFVVCWKWSIILAFFSLFGVDSMQPYAIWVLYLFCILVPLQPFINFVMFLVKSPDFRHNYVLMWRRLFRCIHCCSSQYDLVTGNDDSEEWVPSAEDGTINGVDDDVLSLRDS